jgi:predicted MFS family arabinose efflux permease
LKQTVEGARYSYKVPVIMGVLVMTVVINTFALPVARMIPVFTEKVLRVGPGLLGLLLAALPIGTVMGSLALSVLPSPKRPALAFSLGVLFMISMLVAFSLSTIYTLSFIFFFLSGFGQSLFSSRQISLLLNNSTSEMRGRVLGLLSLCIGTAFLGTLMAGAIAESLGPGPAGVIGGGTAIVLVLLTMVTNRAMRS